MRAALDLAQMATIFAAVGGLGFLLVRGLPGVSRAELAGWAWAAGLVALAAAEATLLLLGIRPDPWRLWSLLAAFALVFRSRPAETPRASLPPGRIGRLAWAVALVAAAFFLLQAVSEPMWAWDFIAIWGFKGKTLFLSGGLPSGFFHDSDLAFVHPSYPLLLPVLFAALSTLAGGWDSQALALLFPGFEIATLLVLWGFLRRRNGRGGAAIGLVLTAGFFPLYQSFLVGLAEIPMALGFLLASTSLLDALDRDGPFRPRPLALAALFCCALKTEGMVFLLLLAATTAVAGPVRRRSSRLRAASIFVLVVLLHFGAARLLHGPSLDPRLGGLKVFSRGFSEPLHRLSATASYLLRTVLVRESPFLLGVAAILCLTSAASEDLLLWPLAGITALYAVAPVVSTWSDPTALSRSSFERVVSALMPVLFLVLGTRMSPVFERFSLRFSRGRLTMK